MINVKRWMKTYLFLQIFSNFFQKLEILKRKSPIQCSKFSCVASEATTIIEYHTAISSYIFKLFCFYTDNKNDFVASRFFSRFYHII